MRHKPRSYCSKYRHKLFKNNKYSQLDCNGHNRSSDVFKNNSNTVTVSGIVSRLDEWNNNENEVNILLLLICKERNILFFSHDESIDPSKHMTESKLHLNSLNKIFLDF